MGEKTNRIPELFGSMVFNEHKMEQYIPEEAMKVWRQCLKSGQPLPLSVAISIPYLKAQLPMLRRRMAGRTASGAKGGRE